MLQYIAQTNYITYMCILYSYIYILYHGYVEDSSDLVLLYGSYIMWTTNHDAQ